MTLPTPEFCFVRVSERVSVFVIYELSSRLTPSRFLLSSVVSMSNIEREFVVILLPFHCILIGKTMQLDNSQRDAENLLSLLHLDKLPNRSLNKTTARLAYMELAFVCCRRQSEEQQRASFTR